MRQLADATGAVSLARSYQPYGKLLASDGSSATSYGFTNEYTSQGLIYLRARWYSPYLNQFIQADPIVPDPYHPWEWNRFTYSRNNPIKFSDPSGKTSIVPLAAFVLGEPYSGSWQPDGTRNGDKDGKNRTTYYPPKWEQREKDSINQALADVAEAYSNAYIGEIVRRYFAECWPKALLLESIRRATPENTFLKVHGGRITFVRTAENATQYFSQQNGALTTSGVWANTVDARKILIFSNATANDVVNHPRWIVHEVGHAFERAMEETVGRRAGREGLPAELLVRTAEDDPNAGFAGGFMEWQYSKQNKNGEIFADMFIGWVYNQWGVRNGRLTSLAVKRAGYMNSRMPGWITVVILKRGGLP